jgi:Asp-tRNA(Asn)/Glu-tRNA(Gln) amidotransferase A subunit family amidase
MKPTYNAISLKGQKAFAPTFDTLGFFARSVEDLQLLADVFALTDDSTPTDIPLKGLSVALMKTPMWPQAGPGTVAAMEKAAAILQSRGAQVAEVSLPPEANDLVVLDRPLKVILGGEAHASFLREYRVGKANLDAKIRGLVENDANYTKKERMEAFDSYARMRDMVNKLAENYSVILAPSAVDKAPLGLGDMGNATFNTLWTASLFFSLYWYLFHLSLTPQQGFHMPVVQIPAFVSVNGMPVGISLVAPRFHDLHLLRVSKMLGEEALMAEGGWKV